MSLTTSGLVAIADNPERAGTFGPFIRFRVRVVSQNHSDPDKFDYHWLSVAVKEGDIKSFVETVKKPNVFFLRYGLLSTGNKGGSFISTFYPRDFQYLEVPVWHPTKKK